MTPSLLPVPGGPQCLAAVGPTISLALTDSAHTQVSPSPGSGPVINIDIAQAIKLCIS